MAKTPPGIATPIGRHSLPYADHVTRTVGRAVPDIAPRPGRHSLPYTARLSALCIILLLTACSGDPGTGPVEIKWDRDACTRCNMVLSDRQHSAQVRHTPADGRRSQVHTFDDLGCAVPWLDQQPWHAEPSVEIWVTDQSSGHWIDARSAHYVAGKQTSMQYGLGAQTEPGPGTLDFAAAREHIYKIEQTFNIHGGNLDHPNATPTLPPIDGNDAKGQ